MNGATNLDAACDLPSGNRHGDELILQRYHLENVFQEEVGAQSGGIESLRKTEFGVEFFRRFVLFGKSHSPAVEPARSHFDGLYQNDGAVPRIAHDAAKQFRNRRAFAFEDLPEILPIEHEAASDAFRAVVRTRGQNDLPKLASARIVRLLQEIGAVIRETKKHRGHTASRKEMIPSRTGTAGNDMRPGLAK